MLVIKCSINARMLVTEWIEYNVNMYGIRINLKMYFLKQETYYK